MKKLFVVAVTLLSLSSFVVAAQEKAPGSFDRKFGKVKGELSLTAEQNAKIADLDKQFANWKKVSNNQLSADYMKSVKQVLTAEQNAQLDNLTEKPAKPKKAKKK